MVFRYVNYCLSDNFVILGSVLLRGYSLQLVSVEYRGDQILFNNRYAVGDTVGEQCAIGMPIVEK
jgi:hypothetical protein